MLGVVRSNDEKILEGQWPILEEMCSSVNKFKYKFHNKTVFGWMFSLLDGRKLLFA